MITLKIPVEPLNHVTWVRPFSSPGFGFRKGALRPSYKKSSPFFRAWRVATPLFFRTKAALLPTCHIVRSYRVQIARIVLPVPARIRTGLWLKQSSRIGNFVVLKNWKIDKNTVCKFFDQNSIGMEADIAECCLRWKSHKKTLISWLDSLLEKECLVDITLAAEGKFIRAHRLVLCACSQYFEAS